MRSPPFLHAGIRAQRAKSAAFPYLPLPDLERERRMLTHPDGANAYYVHYMPAEAYSKDWSGNYFGAYIWIPEKGDFQRLLSIDFETISSLKAYSKSHTGDIYQSLGLRPGAINSTNTEAPLPGAWFRSKEAGMHELGSALSSQQDSRDIYVTAHSDGAMLMLTRTFDRIGRTPSEKSFTYGINFDTLEIQRTRVATEAERKKMSIFC